MIRAAELRDVADLARLSGVLGYPISETDALSALTETLADKTHLIFVAEAENDGRVCGFIEAERYHAVYSKELLFNVLGLVVDTDKQGQGLGGALLRKLEAEARACGISAIRLNSGEQRLEAHQFYAAQGYVSNHSQKRFIKKL
ncbi:MAG: GNAT family N-acetyltransferase [Streptococcaceae bacterium]|jgi:predicted N-acetyltransferase YhbS|nr:GNAT family N-acetyltransferase [Streptococcaceae bacterium]